MSCSQPHRLGRCRDSDFQGAGTNTAIQDVVSAFDHAHRGEPKGVMPGTGSFIDLRPHGVPAAGLDIGAQVTALGDLRLTVPAMRWLAAHQVNRIHLP